MKEAPDIPKREASRGVDGLAPVRIKENNAPIKVKRAIVKDIKITLLFSTFAETRIEERDKPSPSL